MTASQAGLIAIPRPDEMPSELRPKAAGVIRPHLPDVDLSLVPQVIGFRVLVLPVMPPKQTESGIELAADTVRHLEITRSVGVVLGIGDLAFSPARGYPAGYMPIKVGDWVNFHGISGQDTLIRDRRGAMVKIKYLNDADILGVPRDQDGVSALMVMV
jgi:co-chaperonin GroES (HSP10)